MVIGVAQTRDRRLESHRCVASVANYKSPPKRLASVRTLQPVPAQPNMKVTLKKESNISVVLRRRLRSRPNNLPKPFVVAEIALNILTAADSRSAVVWKWHINLSENPPAPTQWLIYLISKTQWDATEAQIYLIQCLLKHRAVDHSPRTVGSKIREWAGEAWRERKRLTLWIKLHSHGLLLPAKANGRLPQHKWCEILLDGLKSVFRDPKARLLEHLKGCGANQDDFGMITFRLDWVKIKSDFLWTEFALNSAWHRLEKGLMTQFDRGKCVQVEIRLPVVSPKLWT